METTTEITLTGKLEFLTMFLPIKLFTENGEIDLWKNFDEFLTQMNGKKASMDWTREGFWIKADENSKSAVKYENSKDGILMLLKNVSEFGFSNIGAYLPDTLQRLNGRTITISISDSELTINEDPNEEVYGLYFTNNNSCHIPDDKVKEVCKVGTGKDVCIFCTASAKGFECAKFDSYMARQLLYRLSEKTMNSTRIGNCKLLGRKDD